MTNVPSRPSTDRSADRTDRYRTVLDDTLAYARVRDYTGWDYCDGMSSRFRRLLPFDNKWVNLAFQEPIKRAPVNLRPLFLVERRRNFKGAALFAMANLQAHRLAEVSRSAEGATATATDRATATATDRAAATAVDHEAEARRLLDWLVANRCVGYHGFCVGHNHVIQQLDYQKRPGQPGIVATSFAVKALLAGASLDPTYADLAATSEDFVVHDLDYRPVDGGATIKYHQQQSDDYYTVNAGALGARLFLDLYARDGGEDRLDRATAILDFIADHQHAIGGWTYRLPPEASHLSMDNHHNGFIAESLLRYRAVTGSARYDDTIDRALAFHRHVLFDDDGAPNWDETSTYPRDVHAAAQGVVVFTMAGNPEFARRIIDWTLGHLYAGDGRFYYRRERFYTNRTTLMRWCEAWMAYAISYYLVATTAPAAGVVERPFSQVVTEGSVDD